MSEQLGSGVACRQGRLHELAQEYRDVLRSQGRSPLHVETVHRHLLALFDSMGISDPAELSRSKIQAALGAVVAKGRALRTVHHHFTSMRAFCRWAADEDNAYLPRDPTRGIKSFRAERDPRHIRRALTDEELGRLFDAANRDDIPRYGLAGRDWSERWHAMVATGLREGTLGRVSVGQWTLEGERTGVHVFGFQELKRGKDRFVPVRPDSALRIKNYLTGRPANAVAFPIPSRYAVLKVLRKHLALAGIDAGGEQMGPDGVVRRHGMVDVHSLRVTCGTRMMRAGVAPKIAQDVLGHSTMELTMRIYSKVTQADSSAAVLRMPPMP
jgi:integrase